MKLTADAATWYVMARARATEGREKEGVGEVSCLQNCWAGLWYGTVPYRTVRTAIPKLFSRNVRPHL